MRSVIWVLFFLIFLTELKGQGIQGKFVIGINAAQVDGDRIWGYNRVGPVIGGAANMKLGKKISFQPEIYYSMRGAGSTINQPYLLSILHYVDVPLIIQYQLKKRWALQFGMTPCYLVNAKLDQTGYGYYDITNFLNKYDLCFTSAIEFALAPEWAINARFNYSALPIEKTELSSVSAILSNGGWFNNYLNFTIRYTFLDRAATKNDK